MKTFDELNEGGVTSTFSVKEINRNVLNKTDERAPCDSTKLGSDKENMRDNHQIKIASQSIQTSKPSHKRL